MQHVNKELLVTPSGNNSRIPQVQRTLVTRNYLQRTESCFFWCPELQIKIKENAKWRHCRTSDGTWKYFCIVIHDKGFSCSSYDTILLKFHNGKHEEEFISQGILELQKHETSPRDQIAEDPLHSSPASWRCKNFPVPSGYRKKQYVCTANLRPRSLW